MGKLKLSALRLLCCGWLVGAMNAQADDPVRVVTCFSVDALAAIQAHLAQVLPDEVCRVERLDTLEVSGRWSQGIGDVDVACGVDTQLLAMAADRGDFVSRSRGRAPTFWIDEEQRFVTPWARGWVFVWRAPVANPIDELADLADPRLEGQLALPSPRAAPSVWGNWLRQWTQMGEGEDRIFAWLVALDARVGVYQPSEGAVLAALEAGKARVGVLPSRLAFLLRDRLERRSGAEPLALGVTAHGLPLQCMSLAVVAASPRLARAERVFDALLDYELTQTLRDEHGVLTPDLGGESEDRHALGTLADEAFPFAPLQTEFAKSLLRRWDEHVRGHGGGLEQLELIFDVVLTLAFVAIVWWLFRNIDRGGSGAVGTAAAEPTAAEPTAAEPGAPTPEGNDEPIT